MSPRRIKPCPFCGGIATVKNIKDGTPFYDYCGDNISVMCTDCFGEGNSYKSIEYAEEGSEKKAIKQAIKVWNRRVKDE